MSTSTTYRPGELTEEQRAAIAERARRDRLRNELLPVLRQRLHASARRLSRYGSVPATELSTLTRRMEKADSVEEFRSLAVSMGRIEAARTGGVFPHLALPIHIAQGKDMAQRIGLQFDVAQLALEFESIGRTAIGLDLELAELAIAQHKVVVVAELARTAEIGRTTLALDELRAMLDRLDISVSDALADAECLNKTVAAIQDTLGSMGFRVANPIVGGHVTLVFGNSDDGRVAQVEVSGNGDHVEIMSRFSNPGDAVPGEHPDADAVCEPAVLDQANFHREIEGTPGLRVSRIRTPERPTRGSAMPGTPAATARRPSQGNSGPTQRRIVR